MKFKRWICATAASVLLASTFTATSVVNAENTRTIADESIYDLLVDRFFNGSGDNDLNVDPEDPSQFAGGDFKGIGEKLSSITEMGFTMISLGSIFDTETYDGSMVTSYEKLEPQFGTSAELTELISLFEQFNVSAMVDFPLSNVSDQHEWAQDASKADWIASSADGKVHWDLNNQDVQTALIDAAVNFVSTYNVGGVRLTNLEDASTSFINEMISAIKEVNEEIYVISNEESDANFDATYFNENTETFRNVFKNVDQDSSQLLKHIDPYVQNKELPTQLMIDNLTTNRFVYSVEAFPPTRIKLAVASTLLLPGVPVMQYGTEIAMNGQVGPESHQLFNFRTDEELVGFITNIQTLRNKSETLRSGDFKLIKNDDGFLAFERFSDEERWIVIINNSGKTTRVDLTEEEIGADKEIRGMLENDVTRANEDGIYPIVLDREIVEVFQVTEKRGINKSYIIALGFVYVIFIGFIVAIIKRSKRKRAGEN